MSETTVQDLIAEARIEVEQAAEAILAAAERCLRDLGLLRTEDSAALESAQASLCAILEACAFQDLIGQRLARISAALTLGPIQVVSGGLLNGPATRGQGLDQATADALMASSA